MTATDDTDPPGFIELLGSRDWTSGDGRARLELDVADKHLNRAGTVHGGVIASLMDMAMGQAIRSSSGEGDVPATSQLTVTYLRPGSSGSLVVTAKVSKQGDDLTMCEADVEQEGKTLAHALATFAVLHT
jgi:uncharacterized protein (TIGR00369 family)